MTLVNLIDEDPDLAAGIGEDELPEARAALVAVVDTVPEGPWSPAYGDGQYGALVLDGLLILEMTVAGRSSAEILGASDVLLPLGADEVTFVPRTMSWRAVAPTRIAWLGSPLLAACVRWPALAMTMHQRSERRIARLLAMQSVAHLPRVEERLLCILRLLAERWGQVCIEGVRMPLSLTHRTLGELIAAERSSVTGGITALEESRRLDRLPTGGWLLRGDPPRIGG